jgi:hypothetical protein
MREREKRKEDEQGEYGEREKEEGDEGDRERGRGGEILRKKVSEMEKERK